MVDFDVISESYDSRITRRLEYLNAVTETVFASEDNAYRKDNETDAFVAISTLSLIITELRDIIEEMNFLSKTLHELQELQKRGKTIRVQETPA